MAPCREQIDEETANQQQEIHSWIMVQLHEQTEDKTTQVHMSHVIKMSDHISRRKKKKQMKKYFYKPGEFKGA